MQEKISIVIPVFNEADSIGPLIDELVKALDGAGPGHEIIVVDDGSTDGRWQAIKKLQSKYPELKAIRFGRNFGQTAALSAGISRAGGDIIITMDGDGQNDPADIPRLLSKMSEGYDLVSGWRKSRKDPFLSRQIAELAGQLAHRVHHRG